MADDEKENPTKEDEQSNLPSVIPSNVAIPEPILLDFNHNQDDVLRANIELYNTRLKVVHALWSRATSFGKALVLIRELDNLIKLRAEIMGTPYGAALRNTSKGSSIFPID